MSAFNPGLALPGTSFQHAMPSESSDFDILGWHTDFESCVRYFLDHAQWENPVQRFAAFLNIRLPFQQVPNPIYSFKAVISPPAAGPGPAFMPSTHAAAGFSHHFNLVSLTPYIRRLVAMGLDSEGILHGFFGDQWMAGIGPLREAERRNFLFAAKSRDWLTVKEAYDMDAGQHIPYLKPLQSPSEREMQSADSRWSEWLTVAEREWEEWLAMEDWVLGPRTPRQLSRRTFDKPVKTEDDS